MLQLNHHYCLPFFLVSFQPEVRTTLATWVYQHITSIMISFTDHTTHVQTYTLSAHKTILQELYSLYRDQSFRIILDAITIT